MNESCKLVKKNLIRLSARAFPASPAEAMRAPGFVLSGGALSVLTPYAVERELANAQARSLSEQASGSSCLFLSFFFVELI
jgi:hypothetical protein